MKTPYDAAVRWRKSELDLLRRQVVELEEQQQVMCAEMQLLEKQFATEELVARHQPLYSFAKYATLNRNERAGLQRDMDRLEADIAELRERVANAFQDFKALDMAAHNHVLAEQRKRASREQAELDEIASRKVVAFAR
jgi:chromosome segregation ATPase